MTNVVVPNCWPPFPPPGPSCSCNCDGGFNQAVDCWQQIANFKAFLQQMLTQIGPIPIQGVVDGSDAKPGNVGEYFRVQVTQAVPIGPTQQPVSLGVLPPGDWNYWIFALYQAPVTSGEFWINPLPAGFSDALFTFVFTGTAFDPAWMTVTSSIGRASITVPTLVAITLMSNYAGNAAAATTAQVTLAARRMR